MLFRCPRFWVKKEAGKKAPPFNLQAGPLATNRNCIQEQRSDYMPLCAKMTDSLLWWKSISWRVLVLALVVSVTMSS